MLTKVYGGVLLDDEFELVPKQIYILKQIDIILLFIYTILYTILTNIQFIFNINTFKYCVYIIYLI